MNSSLQLRALFVAITILSHFAQTYAEPKQPLLADRAGMFVFPIGVSQAMVLGGTLRPSDPSTGIGTFTTTAELYDYKTGSRPLRDAPFEVREAIQLSDGTILILGSVSGSLEFAVYRQATDEWQMFGPPAGGTFYASPFLIPIRGAGALFGGGGICLKGGCQYSHESYVLNPSSLTWQRVGDTNLGWDNSGLMIGDGRAVLLSGNKFEIFDPATRQWTVGPTMPWGDIFRAVALPGDRILALGGHNQVFDATTNQWTILEAAPPFITGESPTLLPNGQVLLAGGIDSHVDRLVVQQSTLLLDPATGATRAAAPLYLPRAHFGAVVVADGTMLIVGGTTQLFSSRTVPAVLTSSVESFPWEPSFGGMLDAGFYVVTATQQPESWGGLWAIGVNSSGSLTGGLNVGGYLQSPNSNFGQGVVTSEEVGFGAFYISESQTVSAVVDLQPVLNGRPLADVRILDSNRKIIAGPVAGERHIELGLALLPGFYIVEVHPDPILTEAAFALAVNASRLDAGGFGGSLISRFAGVPGFVSFYLPTRQTVSVNLLNQNTFGYPRGAGELVMTIKDGSGNTIFQAGPGAMK